MFSIGMAAERQFVAIATGGTGGTYYPIGGALAQMLSNNVEGLIVTAMTLNASIENWFYCREISGSGIYDSLYICP